MNYSDFINNYYPNEFSLNSSNLTIKYKHIVNINLNFLRKMYLIDLYVTTNEAHKLQIFPYKDAIEFSPLEPEYGMNVVFKNKKSLPCILKRVEYNSSKNMYLFYLNIILKNVVFDEIKPYNIADEKYPFKHLDI